MRLQANFISSTLPMHAITTKTAVSLDFIDNKSKEIYRRKEHVLIGISPCNSYYNCERIEKTITWVLEQGFADFHFFTGEDMWYYNYQAFGYSPEQAKAKATEKQKQLHKKLTPILEKFSISKDKIITSEKLADNKIYKDLYQECRGGILQNQQFVEILFDVATKIKNTGTSREPLHPSFFIKAFAIEIPLFLYTPSILGLSSSCFVYHQNNEIYEYIFKTYKISAPSQGFFVLNFT